MGIVTNQIIRNSSSGLALGNKMARTVFLAEESCFLQVEVSGFIDGSHIADKAAGCHQFITAIDITFCSHKGRVVARLDTFVQLERHAAIVGVVKSKDRNGGRT